MRDDLNASEKRLIAALDRIDRIIDRAGLSQPAVPSEPAAPAELQDLRAENQRLSQELVALHERQAATLAACEERLAEAHQRLVDAGQEAARLAAANEALAQTNRSLIEAASPGPDEARQALEAEIDSLRAARAAEIGQMGDILTTLDRMIAPGPPANRPAAEPVPAHASPAVPGTPPTPVMDGIADADLDEERG